MERDRDGATVTKELTALGNLAKVLLLQETQGYAKALAAVPGFRVIAFRDVTEQDECTILVHDSLTVDATGLARMTWDTDGPGPDIAGWKTVRGGTTPAKWAPWCEVGGVRFVSLHTPPTIQSPSDREHSPNRWDAYKQMIGALPAVVTDRCIIGADWNMDEATENAPEAPRKALPALGFNVVAPAGGTHGSRTIDYFACKSVAPKNVRVAAGTWGSDHRPALVDITV